MSYGCGRRNLLQLGLVYGVSLLVPLIAPSVAWSQVPPGDASSCAAVSTSPTVTQFVIETANSGTYGFQDERVRFEITGGAVIKRWDVITNPGKPLNSLILNGGGKTSVINYLPNGAYQSSSSLALPGSIPLSTITMCYGETSTLPPETLPNCADVTTVSCKPGFSGIVSSTAIGGTPTTGRPATTTCVCGTATATSCNGVDTTASNACAVTVNESETIKGSCTQRVVSGGTVKYYTITGIPGC